MTQKPCKHCGSMLHLSWRCLQNPNREAQTRKKLKNAKIAFKWERTRNQWYKANPPTHEGYYFCYICGKALRPKETTLDHIKSRSRHPELRFEMTNLAPCCFQCNFNKGSRDIEEL